MVWCATRTLCAPLRIRWTSPSREGQARRKRQIDDHATNQHLRLASASVIPAPTRPVTIRSAIPMPASPEPRNRNLCIIRKPQLLRDLLCGEFQIEQLYQTQPLSCGKISPVDPLHGEIVEGVSTCGTAASFILQPVEFFRSTTWTKPTTVFEAKLRQIFSGC